MADTSQQGSAGSESSTIDSGFRPLTRSERRNLWLKEYGEQDFALQAWARLVEKQQLEIEVMFQMHGLLVFGSMVSTEAYAQFYINLHEEMYREQEPETADFLREYYTALIPAPDQPEIGPEGLPIVFRLLLCSPPGLVWVVRLVAAGQTTSLPTHKWLAKRLRR